MIPRGLLVSVRDVDEAGEALAGGAAIVDVKEPLAGPLGAADAATIGAIASLVGRRVPWTHACGELLEAGGSMEGAAERVVELTAAARVVAEVGPVAIKAGLAGAAEWGWREALSTIAGRLPRGTGLVAVAYADWEAAAAPDPLDVIAAAREAGCIGVLVDTHDKRAGGLFGQVDRATLARWVAETHAVGLPVALAGKVGLDELPAVAALGADVAAVRSAVCRGGPQGSGGARLGRVDRTLVAAAVGGFHRG